jgi:hypothetical protein
VTRSTRPDRLDRLVLTGLGVLLAAAGAYGLLRGGGGLGDGAADDPLLLPSVRDFVADNQLLFWAAAAIVALVVAWLGYRWLRAQFPASKTVRHLEFEAGPPAPAAPASQGEIRLSSAAAAQALQDDLEAHDDVGSAKARLLRGRPRPDVELRVGVADDVDVAALARWIEDEALGRLAQALQVDELTARTEVRFTGPAGRSLR